MYIIRISSDGQGSSQGRFRGDRTGLDECRKQAALLKQRLPKATVYIFDTVAFKDTGNGYLEEVREEQI